MKRILIALALLSSTAQAKEVYTNELPKAQLTKLEAMKILLQSDNKAQVYKCQLVELSSKGTVKNK